MLKPVLFVAALAAFAVAAQPAAAERATASYECKVTPDGKVIMAVTNPNAFPIYCSVNCHFKFPSGMASTSCSREVAANTVNAELCVKSTGGDKYTLKDGSLDCIKH